MVYGIYNELVTGANLNQQTSLGGGGGHIVGYGWWENLQESPIFDGKKPMVSCRLSPANQSGDWWTLRFLVKCHVSNADITRTNQASSAERIAAKVTALGGSSILKKHPTMWALRVLFGGL